MRGNKVTERIQALRSPAPPVPSMRTRAKPFGEPKLTPFEQFFARPQSSSLGRLGLDTSWSSPSFSTVASRRQATAVPRSRAVYDPILNQTTVFQIHDSPVSRVDRQMSHGDDAMRDAAHRALTHGASWSGRFGHTGRRSSDIPSVCMDARIRKGLAEDVVGRTHHELGGPGSPLSPHSPHPAFGAVALRRTDTEAFRHKMDSTIHDWDAYHRGHRLV